MRAVVENNPTASEVPALDVMICKGMEDLTIKVNI